jgi:hypothetical protein
MSRTSAFAAPKPCSDRWSPVGPWPCYFQLPSQAKECCLVAEPTKEVHTHGEIFGCPVQGNRHGWLTSPISQGSKRNEIEMAALVSLVATGQRRGPSRDPERDFDVDLPQIAAIPEPPFAASMFHQYPPHGLGRSGKEVASATSQVQTISLPSTSGCALVGPRGSTRTSALYLVVT